MNSHSTEVSTDSAEERSTHNDFMDAIIDGNMEVVARHIESGADVNFMEEGIEPPLHVAAGGDHLVTLQLLLSNGAEIDKRNNVGITPLLASAVSGKLENLEFLIESGADVKATVVDGSNLLHCAALSSNPDVLKRVLKIGFNLEKKNLFGQTAFLNAARVPGPDNLEILLEARAYPKSKDILGQNALHYAVRYADIETVKVLLRRPSLVNLADEEGETPLFSAVMTENVEITRLLLDTGARVNQRDKYKATAIYNAVYANRPEQVKFLLSAGADPSILTTENSSAIHLAAKQENSECLKLLLDAGGNPNLHHKDYPMTPIQDAIEFGTDENVDLLQQYGAEITKCEMSGITPLMMAAKNPSPDMFTKIAEMNFSFHDQNDEGSSVLHYAAWHKDVETLELILSQDVDVDIFDCNEDTPLKFAAGYGTAEGVKFLLAAGANVNSTGHNGETPLFSAIQHGKLENAEILIIAGADVNLANKYGYCPLHIGSTVELSGKNYFLHLKEQNLSEKELLDRKLAECARIQGLSDMEEKFTPSKFEIFNRPKELQNGPLCLMKNVEIQADLVNLLLKYGANVNAMDKNACTPLHYALYAGILDVAKELMQAGAKIDIKNHWNHTAAGIAEKNGWNLEELKSDG